MTALRVVADDLTGALDAGAQFTGTRGPLPCTLGAVTSWDLAVDLAVNLGCRDATSAMAAAASRAALPILDGADLRFKKVDSLLRGHWAAELAVWIVAGTFGTIVLAPAFPAQNRATRLGRQWARFPGQPWSLVAIDPAAALAAEGVSSRTLVEPFDVPDVAPGTVLICDAETDDISTGSAQICAMRASPCSGAAAPGWREPWRVRSRGESCRTRACIWRSSAPTTPSAWARSPICAGSIRGVW